MGKSGQFQYQWLQKSGPGQFILGPKISSPMQNMYRTKFVYQAYLEMVKKFISCMVAM